MERIESFECKKDAKKALENKWGAAIIIGLIYILLMNVPNIIDSGLHMKKCIDESVDIGGAIMMYMNDSTKDIVADEESDLDESDKEKRDKKEDANDNYSFSKYYEYGNGFRLSITNDGAGRSGYKTPNKLLIFSYIWSALTCSLSVGYIIFCLNLNRGKEAFPAILFSKFNITLKLICVQIYKGILIFLQALLLIIPGIIATFKYAMTEYIIADDETISVSDAVEMSKEMMKGHKMELFGLYMSFLGWIILSALSCGVLYIAYVGPYFNSSVAGFYDRVKQQYESKNTIEYEI